MDYANVLQNVAERVLFAGLEGCLFSLNSFWFTIYFLCFLVLQIETYLVKFDWWKRHSFVYVGVMERNLHWKPGFKINLEEFLLSLD